MATEALTPRDFCASHDEWFPVATPHWDIKRNNLLKETLRESLSQATSVADARTLKQRFFDLAQQWADETGHLSSPTQKMLHPSYQAILGMGQEHKNEVIDLLIQDMKENRRQWFWALSYLAQANPIKPEDAGRIDQMIKAWVRWAETRVRA